MKTSGGLSLATREGWAKGGESGPAIVPNKPDESLLLDAINYRSLEMPPRDNGGKLSDEEIDILTKWIQQGAADPRSLDSHFGGMSKEQAKSWWAFQPVVPSSAAPSPNDIDAFIDRARGLAGRTRC